MDGKGWEVGEVNDWSHFYKQSSRTCKALNHPKYHHQEIAIVNVNFLHHFVYAHIEVDFFFFFKNVIHILESGLYLFIPLNIIL